MIIDARAPRGKASIEARVHSLRLVAADEAEERALAQLARYVARNRRLPLIVPPAPTQAATPTGPTS